ncbi:MAG: phosphatidylglycerophosphatase A [Pseudomonadota bacterium]
MTRLIATFAYVGYMRPASGTWGSAAAIPVAALLHAWGGFAALALATALAFVAGVWATRDLLRTTGETDPSEVVIDEVVGQWIALWPLSLGLAMQGSDAAFLSLWPGWVTAFLAFRIFDIWKPGPIGLLDQRHDAWGVMLDDVLAGFMAATLVAVAAVFAHGVMGA